MSENPYKPPSEEAQKPAAVGVKSGSRDDLKSVAFYQKGIITCILLYLVAVIAQIAISNGPPTPILGMLSLAITIGTLINGLVGTVFVFLLAIKVYSTGVGILLGVLTLIPCFGLIILLIVNGKATSILRQNEIKVGLLGANLSKI